MNVLNTSGSGVLCKPVIVACYYYTLKEVDYKLTHQRMDSGYPYLNCVFSESSGHVAKSTVDYN